MRPQRNPDLEHSGRVALCGRSVGRLVGRSGEPLARFSHAYHFMQRNHCRLPRCIYANYLGQIHRHNTSAGSERKKKRETIKYMRVYCVWDRSGPRYKCQPPLTRVFARVYAYLRRAPRTHQDRHTNASSTTSPKSEKYTHANLFL